MRASSGFGLIELLIVVAIVGVLVGISTPALLRARSAANESAVVASLRNINSAQRAFAASCGSGFYAPSLEALGASPVDGQPFLGADLARPAPVRKNGYDISLSGTRPDSAPAEGSCTEANGGPAASELLLGYVATADAEGTFSGSKDYWTNTSGALFEMAHSNSSFTSTNIVGAPVADPQARAVQSAGGGRGDVGGLKGGQ